VILLAEHDEPTTLAAKKKRQHGASSWPTSTPKNRVWGFENTLSGRPSVEPQISWETATGSVQYTYQIASGRAEWLSRDPIAEKGGMNLYEYVGDDPIDRRDILGLCGTFTVELAPGGGARTPKNGTHDLPVIITFHPEPGCCCKNIKYVQHVSYNGGNSMLDGTPSPLNPDGSPFVGPPSSPYYPFQGNGYTHTGDDNSMYDDPAFKDWRASGVSFTATTCAVCLDSGSPKTLGCVTWGFTVWWWMRFPQGLGTQPATSP